MPEPKKVILKIYSIDFEDNIVSFSVPDELMKKYRWGMGEAEIDISGICEEIPKA